VSVARRWTWLIRRTASGKTKRALVTGGSSGIGAASAADDFVREIRDQGGEAIALKADVSRDDEVRTMFDRLGEAFRRIDILVANAGIQKDSAITDTSLEVCFRIEAGPHP
jgi:glucose 1-dehydrogenase